MVYDRVEKKGKFVNLPFDCEIHFSDDGLIYMMNPVRMFALDIGEFESEYDIQKVFRPEF